MRTGARVVVAEAFANVRAWWVAALALALAVGAAAFVVASQTAEAAGTAYADAAHLDAVGRHVLQVRSDGGALSARMCDAFGAVDGARASMAVATEGRDRMLNGHSVFVRHVTPGVVDFLPVVDRDAPVYAGSLLASEAGLVEAAPIGFDGEESSTDGLPAVSILPATPRTTSFDDAALVVVPPSDERATSCWVEADGDVGVLTAVLGNVAPDGTRFTLSAWRSGLDGPSRPEDELASLPGDALTVIAGLIGAILALGWWFVRREEWALYGSFGLSLGRRAGITAVEWLCVVGVPVAIGGAWGIASAPSGLNGRAYDLALVNLLVVALLAVLAIPLWTLRLHRMHLATVLKGD